MRFTPSFTRLQFPFIRFQFPSLSLSLLLASILLLPGAAIAVELDSSDTKTPEYERARVGIERKYQADKARCATLQGNQKDVCEQKAESTARINQQTLDAKDKRSVNDHIDTADAKTQAQYDLDKVRCDDMSGDSKALCLQKAKTSYEKSKADVELSKNTLDESREAAENKTEAEYALALKKCDSLAGLKKDRCQDKAKEKYRVN